MTCTHLNQCGHHFGHLALRWDLSADTGFEANVHMKMAQESNCLKMFQEFSRCLKYLDKLNYLKYVEID